MNTYTSSTDRDVEEDLLWLVEEYDNPEIRQLAHEQLVGAFGYSDDELPDPEVSSS